MSAVSTRAVEPTLPAPETPRLRPPRHEPESAAHGDELREGSRVGRFQLLDQLGGGGMGVVWSAYDPELDRRVALKFVRADLADPEMLVRLQREAQALARVSHPNVIAVHDVGGDRARLYIAQEFVRGVDLARWLEQPRGQADILGVFVQAAHGLAAAHAAGIVHRDFKPANVLVGDDGRVRVLDFGLAREAATAEPSAIDVMAETGAGGALATPLTAVGAVMGTPLYMAPEQHHGEVCDARGDQFGFCVALYDALYRELPFAGTTRYEIAMEVSAGNVRPAPKGTRVPTWLRDVVCRGLRARPSDRFATMNELIDALGRDVSGRRRRRIAIAAGVVAVAAIAVTSYLVAPRSNAEMCGGAERKLAGVWDDTRKARAQAAFAATGLPYASRLWERTEHDLGRYSDDWVAMSRDACRATRVTGEQSEDALDLRMSCLGERLQELRAAGDLFVAADAKVVERAGNIAGGLTSLADCANLDVLRAPMRPPADHATRARVDAIRDDIARARALERAGKYQDGLAVASSAVAAANQLEFLPTRAEALMTMGRAQIVTGHVHDAEPFLVDSFTTAIASRHDEIALRSATLLVTNVGEDGARPKEGEQWAKIARAVLARRPDDATNAARLDGVYGGLLDHEGRYDEALAVLRSSLATQLRVLGPDNFELSRTHNLMAFALQDQGNYQGAIEEYDLAIAIVEKAVGPDHPDVAKFRGNRATVLADLGKYDDAIAEQRKVLAAREHTLPAGHWLIGEVHANIGMSLYRENKLAEALAELRTAIAISEPALPPDSDEVADYHDELGLVLAGLHRYDEALAEHREALARFVRALGADHVKVANARLNIALALHALGRDREALGEVRPALARRIEVLGLDHRLVGEARHDLAIILLALHQPGAALDEDKQALAIKEKVLGPDHPVVASTLEGLAEDELALQHPREALAYATRAAAIYDKAGDSELAAVQKLVERAKRAAK